MKSDKPEYYLNKNGTQIRVGVIVVISFLALVFGYGWLQDWFMVGRYTRIQVLFANANNIERGDSVTIYGVKRGRVQDIGIGDDGALLTLIVELDKPLPVDTDFFISDADLIGSKQVDIIPGSSSTLLRPEIDIPQGKNAAGLSSIIPRVDRIMTNIDLFLQRLSDEESFIDEFLEIVQGASETIKRIDKALERNEDNFDSIINNLDETFSEFNSFLKDNRESMESGVESANRGFNELEVVLLKIQSLIELVEPVATSLAEDDGTLQRLLNDEELYERLIGTTNQIDSLLIDVRKNPRRYFQLRIF